MTLPPFRVGRVVIDPPTALAPMADLTDTCLRTLIKEERTHEGRVALGLVVTEFLSSKALRENAPWVRRLLCSDPRERPLSIQIYGSSPTEMAEAAKVAADAGADILDINMGCPVGKITGHGSGAALLRDPPRASAMVRAVAEATPLPVTVKMRAGWCDRSSHPAGFARMLEESGAAMLAVHPRTREQGYAGSPREDVIAAIKQAVGIPILGNGDIVTAGGAHRLMARTGCDGVMIGRGALRNPRIFCEILGDPPDDDRAQLLRLSFASRYARRLVPFLGDKLALHRARKLTGLVFKGDPEGLTVLSMLSVFGSAQELADWLDSRGAGPLEVDIRVPSHLSHEAAHGDPLPVGSHVV